MKKKYFYYVSVAGDDGMSSTGLFETEATEDEIDLWLRDKAIDNASDFGYDSDPDHFGDEDTFGREWCDESEDYEDSGEIEYWFEEYDSEEHDVQVLSREFEKL